jgi:hypothetical protein
LIGANDVGKTRLLRLIETALSDPEACDMIDLFGVASAEEVAAFIDPDAFDRFGVQDRVDDVAEFAADLEAPALEDELRVGVRLPGQSGYMSAWRYGRCPAELGDARSQAVQEAVGGPTPDTPFEPVKLEYLGRADPRVLPEAVIVPTAPGEIQREVGRVATTLCCVLRELAAAWPGREDEDPTAVFALDEPDADIDPLDLDEEVEPIEIGPDDPDPDWMSPAPAAPVDRAGELSWRWLVDEDQDASQVNRAAVVACRALQDLAGGLLPTFITSDYRLEITPGQPTAIAQGDRVRVQLMRRDTALESCDLVDDADGLRFDLEEAASGYRLWIELALRETVARARMLIHILYQSSRCLQLAAIGDLDTPLDDVRAVVRATLERLRDPRSAAPTDIEPVIEAGEKELEHRPGDPDPRLFARPRPRLYLVDEPEQRLHPRLQRRAARWLTTLMSEWGSQCVVATHSVAFITPSAHTRAYRLTAPTSPTTPRSPSSIRPR